MINQIVQLGVLAVLSRSTYFLAEVFSPKVEVSPPVKPEGASETFISKEPEPVVNPKLRELFPPERLQAIKRRELKKYKQSLDRKWRAWFESVSR